MSVIPFFSGGSIWDKYIMPIVDKYSYIFLFIAVSRPRSGPLPVLLICTLAAGSLFIILLLLFLIYLKRSRGEAFKSHMRLFNHNHRTIYNSVYSQLSFSFHRIVLYQVGMTLPAFILYVSACSFWKSAVLTTVLNPPGLRAPNRALLKITWSTRMALYTNIWTQPKMVSLDPEYLHYVSVSQWF